MQDGSGGTAGTGSNGTPAWMWILVAVIVLGGGWLAFQMRPKAAPSGPDMTQPAGDEVWTDVEPDAAAGPDTAKLGAPLIPPEQRDP